VATTEIAVPDIGDYQDVPVIEVHVAPGDVVAEEDPLVTLESDKATMDVPATAAGKVQDVRVKVGDTVSEGSVVVVVGGDGAGPLTTPPSLVDQQEPPPEATPGEPAPAPAPAVDDGARATPESATLPLRGAEPGAGSLEAAPAAAAAPAARAAPAPAATPPVEPPATVDLRSDGLADPVRHDDDPPVPAGPVAAGEPGRP
jgi:pyruvate dehydrogenase E2 component (dihydrolipoamide acetyltransferase)